MHSAAFIIGNALDLLGNYLEVRWADQYISPDSSGLGVVRLLVQPPKEKEARSAGLLYVTRKPGRLVRRPDDDLFTGRLEGPFYLHPLLPNGDDLIPSIETLQLDVMKAIC